MVLEFSGNFDEQLREACLREFVHILEYSFVTDISISVAFRLFPYFVLVTLVQ